MKVSLATAATFLLLSAPQLAFAGLFGPKSPVKMLTSKDFNKFIQNSDKASVAAFVAPWCGHCQRLSPEFEKAAANLKGLVNVVAIDCDDESNKRFCSEQEVRGFPTIKTYGGGRSKPQDYQGPRTAKAIVDAALSNMPSFAKKLKNSDSLAKILAPSSRAKSILFTSKASPSPLYRALSSEFHKKLDFYFIVDRNDEYKEIKEKLDLKSGKAAQLVVIYDEEQQKQLKVNHFVYDGKFSYEYLTKFYESQINMKDIFENMKKNTRVVKPNKAEL